jgi:hypothetical protein
VRARPPSRALKGYYDAECLGNGYNPISAAGAMSVTLTNAEKQASWRKRNLKNENGTKFRAQFVSTPAPGRSSSGLPATRVAR